MNNDTDVQFLCKDCVRFDQCEHYDRRKGDAYICKYFHLTETYAIANGNVITSLYPNITFTIQNGRVVTTLGASSFNLEWWNAPYRKRGE